MGCLNVNISELSSRIVSSVSRFGGIVVDVFRTNSPINCSTTDVGAHLRANCSIVCSLSEITNYLNVTPNDIQWITDDIGVFFNVESNVEWIIKTS